MRGRLQLVPGELVASNGRNYRIVEVLDFESVIGCNLESGRNAPLAIQSLEPVEEIAATGIRDIETIGAEDWQTAQTRYAAIKPLLAFDSGRRDVEARAKETGFSFPTLYRWIRRYRSVGTLDALVPEKRGVKRGTKRLSPHAESLIQEAIEKLYLTVERPSVQRVVDDVRRRAFEQELAEVPHANTIRARVAAIDEKKRMRRRGQKERAKNEFTPVPGQFPHADYPLSVVQIDHTPADILLVDDVYRMPIGRPWITLAIDVYSRMVAGYYLSFDAPSETSVAMCVANAVLPKDEWLALHEVDASWPVWGMMDAIHVDNGADFRSSGFRNACMMHDIRLEYRPVKQPRFGGHIERLLGTLLGEMHSLPGTTFSSVKERGEYPSEKRAAMTKSEFEQWLVTLICKVYHKRMHNELGMTPEKQWEIGIFGNAETAGRGVPAIPGNRHALLLDFLPSFERTIQQRGVSIDGLNYYADVLRGWINAKDPDKKTQKRQFIFRRDPRDISVVWFYDPTLEEYFRVPFADQSLPTMSVWEYQEARSRAKAEGMRSVDERAIARAIGELREQTRAAAAKTKTARRKQQRRKEHRRNTAPAQAKPAQQPAPAAPDTSGLVSGDVGRLDDIS